MRLAKYDDYRDSGFNWIGSIPLHWNIKPLFSILYKNKLKNNKNRVRNVLSLSYGRIIDRDVDSNEGLLPESFETYQIVQPGDIILRLTDLQNDQRSLRVGLVTKEGIITSAYECLRSTNEIIPEYAYLLLHSYDMNKVFYGLGAGVRQSMKYSDLKHLPVLLPPADEQFLIINFLKRELVRIDNLISDQQYLVKLLKEKRQAIISHSVTKGLNPDVAMKDSGVEWLGCIPTHWSISQLKFLASAQTGIAKGKDNQNKDTVEIPYLRVANVQDGYLDLTEIMTIEIATSEIDRFLLKNGDVLMNEGGDFDKLGRGCIWRGEIEPCIHQNHVFAIRPKLVSSEWLNQITSSKYAQFYFMSRSKQSTNLASISLRNLLELPVILPPEKEQSEILSFIDKENRRIDLLIEESFTAISLLKERREALISAAVTGKINVRNVANEEETIHEPS